ncbi:rhomboid family intramembrane serine protease [Emticicia sp. BO119]|uniref:rhomboid family intramembrane serine protease n=1 Tax=Emticicia sp. BO119 TaxID=2757768 RepID=UPI0015F0A661|nr:rhomboid family intramembrane serine protease [Emticicia sp. BO119]MBA4849546.1 rhomboid family intramembrane serine protease [Emticicia sp. BO119]
MTEIPDNKLLLDHTYKKYIPIVTTICCAISVILFIGINLEEKADDWSVYKRWGSPPMTDIFSGSYWGLITSNFLHVDLWHIAFNLYGFWILGKKIEFETNIPYYLLFILTASLISSLSQLAFSESTGIGISGVIYAFFGFILLKSKTEKAYKEVLDKKTIRQIIGWTALCVILTYFKIWNVGNAAHIAGFVWGVLLAYISGFNLPKQLSIGSAFLVVLASSIFWTPFSNSWLSYQAYQLHLTKHYDEAIAAYKKILDREATNEWARENRTRLEVHKLQQKINALIENHQYKEILPLLNRINELDPNNEWAKETKKRSVW